jgi:hypothetical protein
LTTLSKKELSQLYYLKKENAELHRRIIELETLATNGTSRITGLPHSKEISDKVGKNSAKIVDLKNLLENNQKQCLDELIKLDKYIQSIDDSFIRQIIVYRFINNFGWEKIAWNMGGNNTAEGMRKKLFVI